MRTITVNNALVYVDATGGEWLDAQATLPFLRPAKEHLLPDEAQAIAEIDKRVASGATGLGDTIEAFLRRIGVDQAVKFFERVTRRRCRCQARKAWLNSVWPYKPSA